jgi:transcriptional regulator with XRE-family HTH domain
MRTAAERRRWNNAAAVVLAAMRNDSDKRQKELAKLVGLSRHVVANIETGRRRIEFSDLIMICKALNLDPVKVLNMVLRWYELGIAQRRRESGLPREVRELRRVDVALNDVADGRPSRIKPDEENTAAEVTP